MYDKLIADLKEDAEWAAANEWETPLMLSDHLKQAVEAIEELSKEIDTVNEANTALYGALPKWIPVSERLPNYGDWVLGLGPKNGYYVCEYRGISHFVYSGDSPWFSSKGKAVNITHWMELPFPPMEDENNV